MLKTICFALLVINFSLNLCNAKHEDTLELVHVIFRHGDRTPEKKLLYPKDPHKNIDYQPIGEGQITNAGKQRLYSLGEALRKRYKDFLGNYTSETLDARSTDYDRTKISLQIMLAALFPPENELIWNKDLKWQPFSFHYETYQKDHVLGQPYRNCPQYKQLYWNYLNSSDGKEKYKNYSEVIKFVSNQTGLKQTSKSIFELCLSLQMEEEYGLKLPEWTNRVYPNILTELVFLEYHSRSATSELKKLSSGYLLKKIIQDTNKKIKNLNYKNRKIYVYSGHEFNISQLMQLLGIYYNHIPAYAACIVIEIHNIKGIRKIKVFYRNHQLEIPKEFKIPNCGKVCNLKTFINLFKKYLPKSRKECNIKNVNKT